MICTRLTSKLLSEVARTLVTTDLTEARSKILCTSRNATTLGRLAHQCPRIL